MKPLCAARACLAATVLLVAAPAFGHAFLDHAMPAVGSTVHQPPHDVRLWFTESLEPAFSRAHVQDAAGNRVDAGDAHVDSADRGVLVVNVPPLLPGKYTVQWRVVSVDAHVTEGDFTFTIAP